MPNNIKQNIVDNKYLYVGYAEDSLGTGFSKTPNLDTSHVAFYLSPFPIESSRITPALFSGNWVQYGTDGADGITVIPGSYTTTFIPCSIAYETESSDFTNAEIDINVLEGATDITSNYTFSIPNAKSATFVITDNNINLTDLPAASNWISDTLQVIGTASGGYPNISITWQIVKIPVEGSQMITATPSNIMLSVDTDGSALTDTYTNATSIIKVYENQTDVTDEWNFSLTTIPSGWGANNTATNNIIVITNATDDSGNITVTGTRANYDNISIIIPVKKVFKGDTGTTGADGNDGANAPDGVNLELDGSSNMTTVGTKTSLISNGLRINPDVNLDNDLRTNSLQIGRSTYQSMLSTCTDTISRGVINSDGGLGGHISQMGSVVTDSSTGQITFNGGSARLGIGVWNTNKVWYADVTIISKLIGLESTYNSIYVARVYGYSYTSAGVKNTQLDIDVVYSHKTTPSGPPEIPNPSIEVSSSSSTGLLITIDGTDHTEMYTIAKVDLLFI